MVDDDGTTAGERLTTGGVGAYVTDGLQEHESSSSLGIPALGNIIRDDHGETQASIELVFADLNDLDTITFRILQDHKNSPPPVTIVGLAVITIDKVVVGSFTENFTDELGMDEIFAREISVSRPFTDELGMDEIFTAIKGGVSFTENMTDELGLDEIFNFVPPQNPPTIPTDIECDGVTNCDITVDASVLLEGVGSTDTETITYNIWASLLNNTSFINTTNVNFVGEVGSISITPIIDTSNVEQSTASTSMVDTDILIDGTALINGVDYLVIYTMGYGMTAVADVTSVQVLHGTDVLAFGADDGSSSGTPESMRGASLSGTTIIQGTGNGADDLKIQFSVSAAGTAFIQGKAIIAIPLDNLTENVDYWNVTQTGSADVVTNAGTGAFENLVTAVFNLPALDDYIVLMSGEGDNSLSAATDGENFRAFIDGSQRKNIFEKTDPPLAVAKRSFSYAQVLNFDAGNTNFTVQVQSVGTANADFNRGRIFVLRTDSFDQFLNTINTTPQTTTATITDLTQNWDNLVSQAYTPNQQEFVLVIGNTFMDENVNFRSGVTRLFDDTTAFTDLIGSDAQTFGTDIMTLTTIHTEQISAVKTYRLQGSCEDPCATGVTFDESEIIVLGLTTAGGAGEGNTTTTDYLNLGVDEFEFVNDIEFKLEIDSFNGTGSEDIPNSDPDIVIEIFDGTIFKDYNMTLNSFYTGSGLQPTDHNFTLVFDQSNGTQINLLNWNVTANQDFRIKGAYMDSNGTAAGTDEIKLINVFVTFNGTRWLEVGNHTEAVQLNWDTSGIPDQVSVNLRARAIDITGSNTFSSFFYKNSELIISHVGGAVQNFVDELGLDEIFAKGFVESFTDELGVEDTMTISLQAAFTDEMGIDSIFEDLFGSRKDFTDELGMQDVQTQRHSFVRPFTDELGIEDTIEAIKGAAGSFTENFTDEIGMEDILVRQLENNVEGFTDELGMEDTLATAKGHTESFTDELGLEDSIAIEKSISENFTDELGLDEIFNTSAGQVIEFTDELGMEDTLATASGFGISILGSDLGMEDSIDVSQGTTVNLIDELGMEDRFAFQVSVIYFTDELGLDTQFSSTIPTGLVFNAIILSVNSPEFDRLGGVFAVICPTNSTLTGLLLNGTFVCTDMSAFFP